MCKGDVVFRLIISDWVWLFYQYITVKLIPICCADSGACWIPQWDALTSEGAPLPPPNFIYFLLCLISSVGFREVQWVCAREEVGKMAERRRKCSLFGREQAVTIAQLLNPLPKPHFLVCAGITQKIVAVQFQLRMGVIILLNSQTKYVRCARCTEKLKGLDLWYHMMLRTWYLIVVVKFAVRFLEAEEWT